MYSYIAMELFSFSFNLYLKHAIDYQITPKYSLPEKTLLHMIYAKPQFSLFYLFIFCHANHKSV
jgi:hypothetical protein